MLYPSCPSLCACISLHLRASPCISVHLPTIVSIPLRVQAHSSLSSLFSVYASLDSNETDAIHAARLMGIGEWLSFVAHMGLFDSNQLSLFGAKCAFKWSRIRSCVDASVSAEARLRHLSYEDFLEAIVRLASVIALPTDKEIAAAGAADAGDFLVSLKSSGRKALDEFVRANKHGWGHEPRQRSNRCVAHFIAYITRIVEGIGHGAEGFRADMKLTLAEVSHFEQRRRAGLTISQLMTSSADVDGTHAARAVLRHHVLHALKKVDVFSVLTRPQLETLLAAMSEARYSKGEVVFMQGDEGDCFHVVVDGQCAITRRNPQAPGQKQPHGDDEPVLLAVLSEGAYFGERSLIKMRVRFATVTATSKSLHTMYISRDAFEAALGCPLETLIPDRFKLDQSELLASLRNVALFRALNDDQLKTLISAFSEETYAPGKWVFRQGDEGDRFYVITAGSAEVIRSEGNHRPTCLAHLVEWSSFGERALLNRNRRFAGIRATTKLKCLAIDKATFEANIGPLLGLLPRQTYEPVPVPGDG